MKKLKRFFKNILNKISRPAKLFDPLIVFSTPYNNIAEEKISGFTRRKLLFTLSLIIAFLVIYGMIFYAFTPDVIFRNTTTAGGDTGAHNYLAKFFLEELFPDLRMSGWDMGWFAGTPMFTFYFPIPFFMIALLSKLITFNISF